MALLHNPRVILAPDVAGWWGAKLTLFSDQCVMAADFSLDAVKAFLQTKNVPVPGKYINARMVQEARKLGTGQSSPSTNHADLQLPPLSFRVLLS